MYVIGIDVGTTAAKSVLFDEEGKCLGSESIEYPTFYPRNLAVEQDPEMWWNAVVQTLKKLLHDLSHDQRQIAAIAISSQAPTMLPLDKHGNILKMANIWMDRESGPMCQEISEKIGDDVIFSITGNSNDPYFLLPKLLHYRNRYPDLYNKTKRLLQVNSYIVYKLTGIMSADRGQAGLSLMYDIHSKDWSESILKTFDITKDLLGSISEPHDIMGTVHASLSKEIGFTNQPYVVAGTTDGIVAALECGDIDDGIIVDAIGTSSVILASVPNDITHRRLSILPHVLPKRHLLFGAMSSTGASLKWFRDQFGFRENVASELLKTSSYALFDAQVEFLGPTPTGIIYLPYLAGERSPIWDSNARGVFFGLSASHTRIDVIKSIMEGVAFGLRHNAEVIQEAAGKMKALRSVGGGSSSDVWNQIKADITTLPVEIPSSSIGAPFGDAVIALYAMKQFSHYSDFISTHVDVVKTYTPREKYRSTYSELYEMYKDLYVNNKNNFAKLDTIRSKMQHSKRKEYESR